jgi:hypothetical protein
METQNLVMISQSVAIIIALMVAIFSSKTAAAAERSTKASFMPIIKLGIDKIDTQKFQLHLENIGREIAHDIKVKIPSANKEFREFTFELIEKGEFEDKWVEYQADRLKKNPDIRVGYKDVFNSNIETVGRFTFQEQTEGEELCKVESVAWRLDLKA